MILREERLRKYVYNIFLAIVCLDNTIYNVIVSNNEDGLRKAFEKLCHLKSVNTTRFYLEYRNEPVEWHRVNSYEFRDNDKLYIRQGYLSPSRYLQSVRSLCYGSSQGSSSITSSSSLNSRFDFTIRRINGAQGSLYVPVPNSSILENFVRVSYADHSALFPSVVAAAEAFRYFWQQLHNGGRELSDATIKGYINKKTSTDDLMASRVFFPIFPMLSLSYDETRQRTVFQAFEDENGRVLANGGVQKQLESMGLEHGLQEDVERWTMLESGEDTVKHGSRTDQFPSRTPSMIGRSLGNMIHRMEGEFVGEKLEAYKGIVQVRNVFNSVTKDSDLQQLIDSMVFEKKAILIFSSTMWNSRLSLLKAIFGKNVEKVCVVQSWKSVMKVVSERNNTSTATIVDVGWNVIRCECIVDNKRRSALTIPFGAAKVLSHFVESVSRKIIGEDCSYSMYSMKSRIRHVLETEAYASNDYQRDLEAAGVGVGYAITRCIADRTVVLEEELFVAIESLFLPTLVGERMALPRTVADCIGMVSDKKVHTNLKKNVVLVGGLSGVINLVVRLENELKKMNDLYTVYLLPEDAIWSGVRLLELEELEEGSVLKEDFESEGDGALPALY